MRRLKRDCFQLAAEGKGAVEVHETSRERQASACRVPRPPNRILRRGTPRQADAVPLWRGWRGQERSGCPQPGGDVTCLPLL